MLKRSDLADFEVRGPTEEEMRNYSNLLLHNRTLGNLLKGIFGVLDGTRMPCTTYNDPMLKNRTGKGLHKAMR